MHGLKIGLKFALLFLLGLSACDNGGGTGGRTGGSGSIGSAATGGTTAAAGAGGDALGGATHTGGPAGGATATGGGTTDGANSAGGAISTGGAIDGTTSTGGTTGGATSAGGTIGGTTSTGGTSSTGGAISTGGTIGAGGAGGAAGGSMTGASRPDAGTDTSAGGAPGTDAGTDMSTIRDTPRESNMRLDAAADTALDAIASNCLCLGKPAPACSPTGHLSYTLARAAAPTADQADAYQAITCAMDMAVAYYNCNTNITGTVRVSYDTGVATADGNINGSIRFGSSRSYMQCATAMHEIAHTQGVGTAPQWAAHVSGGLFVGTNTAAQLQAINATLAKPLDTVIHADSMHFWPYGLNYESEATGTDILVDHCEIVVAIRKDLGL
jgi:stress-induced morphogen